MSGGDGGGARIGTGVPGATQSSRRPAGASALIDAVFPDAAPEPAGPVGLSEVQSLLTGAVRDLARRTGTPRACAWLAQDDGSPLCAAADWQTAGQPPAPDPATFALLQSLRGAVDLGDRSTDGRLAALASVAGLSAAVAVHADGPESQSPAPVVLAVGGPDDRPGHVRPRTLAMMQDVAQRLRDPVATSMALLGIARLDETIRSLERRAALGELVAEIVHEVRNPLVSIKTFLQLLPSRLDDPEFLDDFRPLVVDEVVRLERLVDSVLQHARPSADDRTRAVACVAEVFDTVARLLDHRASEGRVSLDQAVGPGVDEVAMPRDALRQVLLNLTLNALSAAPEGSAVNLRAHAQAVVDGRFVEISVDDQGPGVPEADRRRVFEAFYSTRPDRSGGLGLAICRRLVEEAGGTIRLGEAPGGGARITLRLRAGARL